MAEPDDARTLYKQGFDLFVNGDLDQASERYRAAVAASPDLAIAWNGLAMVLGQLGDLDGAIEASLRLIELEPDEPLGHTSLSMFYMRKGMIPEAEDEKAIAAKLTFEQQGR